MSKANNIRATSGTSANDIATAAYYEWVKAGQPAGRDQEFWFKAEAQMRRLAKEKSSEVKPVNVSHKPAAIISRA